MAHAHSLRHLSLFVFFSMTVFAQSINDYRTIASGNWSDISIWQRYTGLIWDYASSAPDYNSGVVDIRAGHTVTISGQRTIDQTIVRATATLQISSGISLTVNDGSDNDLTVDGSLTLAGDIEGAGIIVVNGTLSWTGGQMIGTGTTQISSGATVDISGGTKYVREGRTLSNHGTMTWTGGDIIFVNHGTIVNESDGVFNLRYDGAMQNAGGSGARTLVNNGTMTRSVASGSLTIQAALNNAGSLAVNTGTITFTNGGTETGSITVATGSTVNFTGGTFTFEAASSFAGAGNVTVNGATLDFSGSSTLTGPFNIANGTFNCISNITLPTMALSGGYLWGTGEVSISNSLNWTGGMMWSAGTTKILAGASVDISGGTKYLRDGRTLSNHGTMNWTGGDIIFVNQGTIINESDGVFNLRYDGAMQNAGGSGARTLVNNGTMTRSVASGSLTIQAALNNAGSLAVNTGTITFTNGGTETGSITVATGSTVNFTGGTFTFEAASSFAGAGTVSVNGATLDFSGSSTLTGPFNIANGTFNCISNITVPTMTLSGGYLWGTGEVSISNSLNWTGGLMWGAGTTKILSGASVDISSNTKYLRDGRTLSNHGTMNWTGGDIIFINQATLTNESDGIFNLRYDGAMQNAGGSGARTLVNNGTMTRSVASGSLTIQAALNNAGSLAVNTGTITFTNGGTETGSITVATGSTVNFTGGTFTFEAASSFAGAGTVSVNGATLDFSGSSTLTGPFNIANGTFNCISNITVPTMTLSGGYLWGTGEVSISNSLNWTGGLMWGAGTTKILSGATVDISYDTKYLRDGRTLSNHGTMTWTGGDIIFVNQATLANESDGVFNLRYDGSMQNAGGSGQRTFNNYGTMNRDITTGVIAIGVPFNNYGIVNILTGILQINAGGTSQSGFSVTEGATLSFGASYSYNSGSLFTGAGNVTIAGGTFTLNGGYSLTGTLQVSGGTLDCNADVSIPKLTISGGTFTGTGNVSVTNSLAWSSGTLSGSGSFTLTASSAATLSGSTKIIQSRLLTIASGASATWTAGNISFSNGAGLTVQSGGTFNSQAAAEMQVGGGTNSVSIAGFFIHTTAACTLSVPVTNTGSIFINSGSLYLPSLTNYSGTTLTGGVYEITGTLRLTGNINTNAAAIALKGASPQILTSANANAIQYLSSNTADGSLIIRSGHNFQTTGYVTTFTNNGLLLVDTGGTFTLNYQTTLTGAGEQRIKGTFSWSGGTIAGNGTTRIDTGGVLTLSAAYSRACQGRTFNNYGTIIYDGTGTTYAQSTTSAIINNYAGAIFDVQSNASMYGLNSPDTIKINNYGIIKRTVSSGSFYFGSGVAVNNYNQLNVQTGTLYAQGGGSSSGTYNVSSGAILYFSNGTHTWNPGIVCSGAGTVKIIGADNTYPTVIIASAAKGTEPVVQAGTTLEIGYNGIVQGTGTLRVKGALNWAGGYMKDAGLTIIDTNATMTISGVYNKYLTNRTLQNYGSAAFTGSGSIYSQSSQSSTIINQSAGYFDLRSDASISYINTGDSLKFYNYGSLSRTQSTGIFTFNGNVPLYNNGNVDVQSGTLRLSGGGSSSGTFGAGSGAVLHFYSGTYAWNPGVVISGSGTVKITGADYTYPTVNITSSGKSTEPVALAGLTLELGYNGIIQGAGALRVKGAFNWIGGYMKDAGLTIIDTNASMTISGAYNKYLTNRTIQNFGTAIFTASSSLYSQSSPSSTIINQSTGTFDLRSDAGISYINTGDSLKIYNYGLLRRTQSISTFTFAANVPLNNHGTVEAQSGSLILSGGGTSSGAFNASGGAVLQFRQGYHYINAGASFGGSGTIKVEAADYINVYLVLNDNSESTPVSASATLELGYNAFIQGTGTLVVNGIFNFNGGRLKDNGIIRIASAGIMNFATSSSRMIENRNIENYGTINFSGTGTTYSVNTTSSTITNFSSGVIDWKTDATIGTYNTPDSLKIHNYGLLKKSGGTGTSRFGDKVAVNNYNAVSVQTGTLAMAGGGSGGGDYQTQSGTVVLLEKGTFYWNRGVNISGPGKLKIESSNSSYWSVFVHLNDTGDVATVDSGSTLEMSYASYFENIGNLRLKGTMTVNSGQLRGTGKIIIDTSGIFNQTGTLYFDDRSLDNYGIINFQSGSSCYAINTTTSAINNFASGLISITSTPSFGNYNTGDSLTISNYGIVRKSANAGTASFGDPIKFWNYGTIEALAGTLRIQNMKNYSSNTLTNGKYVAEATLQIGLSTASTFVNTNNAEIVLRGAASQLQNYNGQNLFTNFATNGASGKFTLENGRDLSLTINPFTNNGAFTLNGGDLTLSGAVALNTNGTFNCGTDTVKGTGSFNVLAGSTLSTAHPQGIALTGTTGGVQNSGTRSFSSSANYIYNGTAAQSTGSGLPATVAGFTIDNSAGVTMTASSTVTNTLTLAKGAVKTGANILTLGTNRGNLGTLNRTAGRITGFFRRWIDTAQTSNILFPVGTDTTYRPVNISFTASPTHAGTLTASFTESNPGSLGLPVNDGGTSLINIASEGYWSLSGADTLTGGVYNLDITADGIAGVSNYSTLRLLKRTTNGSPWSAQGTHTAGTGSNAIPVVHRSGMSGFSDFAVGGASDNSLGVKQCAIKLFIEGFYNPPTNTMIPDTITVLLRNFTAPFAVLDTIIAVVDSSGNSVLASSKAANAVNYFLTIRHRNSIETWISQALQFTNGSATYDLTDAQNKAYGNNLVQKGTKWCIYGGDVNQDGIVDFSDLAQVDNDQFNFVSGYVATDITGDDFVDFSDLSICDNNSYNFISAITPATGKLIRNTDAQKVEKLKSEE